MIRRGTGTYGKVRLAVKHNRYFVESSDVDALQTLLRDTVIRNARVVPKASGAATSDSATSLERSQGKISSVVIEGGTAHQKKHATAAGASTDDVSDALLVAAAAAVEGKDPEPALPEDLQDFYDQVDADDSDDEAFDVVSFEIKPEELENVQSRCIAIEYPLIAEYPMTFATTRKSAMSPWLSSQPPYCGRTRRRHCARCLGVGDRDQG